MRSFWIIQRAPNLVTSVLRRQTLTERPCDHGGRDWRGVTTAQGRLAPQKPEEPPERARPVIPGFLKVVPEQSINFHCFKPPSLWMAAQEANTHPDPYFRSCPD